MSSLATAKMPCGFESNQSIKSMQQPQAQSKDVSPLDVEGLTLGFGRDEIVQAVRESRARYLA